MGKIWRHFQFSLLGGKNKRRGPSKRLALNLKYVVEFRNWPSKERKRELGEIKNEMGRGGKWEVETQPRPNDSVIWVGSSALLSCSHLAMAMEVFAFSKFPFFCFSISHLG